MPHNPGRADHSIERCLEHPPLIVGEQTSRSVLIAHDGTKFADMPTPFRQVIEVPDYAFDDIRKDDIVIDIGANVGAFCIRAARYSGHVFAVEPVATVVLRENIRANGVAVEVIEGALGDGTCGTIIWDGCTVTVPTFPLKKIIAIAGGCDFLKCDCEGAEWQICPTDLDPVRRIEMELHLPPIGGQPAPELLDYISRHYEFTIDRVPAHGPLGLFGFLHAVRHE